jgi:hypothetical protein
LAEKLEKNKKLRKSANLADSLLIISAQHDIQSHNDPQMSLDYHLVDPLGNDEHDEQQSDVLDLDVGGAPLKSLSRE